ncbi:MAG: hypothetical protein J6R99_02745 [Alphaproteobacteria bacterium]|nr:hypothetical protein [Alphaproteobacteria bacterium]MBO7066603.1 hypothetical protein [Alphaproteobacteria bacterium]
MIEKLEPIKCFDCSDTPQAKIQHHNYHNDCINKINEIVDAVNELQNRIDPPSVYQVMKDKDAIIGKHIGEKQRLQDELERTRKALDVAVDALKEIIDWDKCVALQSNDFVGIANKALEQITALEQKDE